MNTKTPLIGVAVAACLISGASQATLIDRGGGLIYDDVLNVTWLQDANYSRTSGYDSDGLMTWQNAMDWAANLSYYDNVRNVTLSDWRLPIVKPINGVSFNYSWGVMGEYDRGYNISEAGSAYEYSTASEMAYMYYNNLNNKGTYNIQGGVPNCAHYSNCLQNTAPFINLERQYYWFGTEDDTPDALTAFLFLMNGGYQVNGNKENYSFYAWAVRDGDVAASMSDIRENNVPEPHTLALFALGLAGLGFARRNIGRQPKGEKN